MTFSTILCLVLLATLVGGGFLWWKSLPATPHEPGSVPNIYTSDNVRGGETWHVEHGGETQEFEVLSVHRSGFFLIRVTRPEGQELDRDYADIEGWVRELPSNRLIEARHLQDELPIELRLATGYN